MFNKIQAAGELAFALVAVVVAIAAVVIPLAMMFK